MMQFGIYLNRVSFICLSMLIFLSANAQNELKQVFDFGTNPGKLKLYLFEPTMKPQNCPLVIVLHGCSQTAENVAKLSSWNELAEKNNFMVAYPEQSFWNNPNLCFNWFEKNDNQRGKGEMESIKQMIDFLISNYSINKKRVFIYGLSAGACMTDIMLCNYPTLFHSGAILAGVPFQPDLSSSELVSTLLQPSKKTSEELGNPILKLNPENKLFPQVIIFQGQNDIIVHPKNGDALVKQWTFIHSIDSIPISKIDNFNGNKDIHRLQYGEQKQVIYYEINHLGHQIMVDPGEKAKEGGKTGLFAVDKDFFSTYWIAYEFGLIELLR